MQRKVQQKKEQCKALKETHQSLSDEIDDYKELVEKLRRELDNTKTGQGDIERDCASLRLENKKVMEENERLKKMLE